MLNVLDFKKIKKETAEIIYEAEIIVDRDGGSVGEILKKASEGIKKIDPAKLELSQTLNSISKEIIRGTDDGKIYKEYLDPSVLHFMQEASKKGLRRGEIIAQYLPIKDLADTTAKKIKNKLKIPLLVAFITVFGLHYVIQDFIKMMEEGTIEGNFATPLWVGHNYYLITFSILIMIAIPLLFFPHKVPKIKDIFRKISAMMAILFISILNKVGQSPVQIIPFIIKAFNIKHYRPITNDMEDLAKLMYHAKFLTAFQASRFMNIKSIKKDFPILLDTLLAEMKLELELSKEIIEEAVGSFSSVLILIPLIPAMYVLGSVISVLAVQAINNM